MGSLDWLSGPVPGLSDENMFLIQTVLTCSALAWLFQRTWQVFTKPLPELIQILGLEAPTTPHVSLASIRSDAIVLHWSRPDNPNSISKYLIQINGVTVGESSRSETSITVTGLKPDHYYAVRVVATSSSNFQAPSGVIRLKTPSKTSSGKGDNTSGSGGQENERGQDGSGDESTTVRTHSTPLEPRSSAPVAVGMSREHSSGGHIQSKRQGLARRSTPGGTVDPHTSSPNLSRHSDRDDEQNDGAGRTVQQLTEILESLRREAEELEKQVGEEDDDYATLKAASTQERDQLKQALKEKEDASAELRKQVAGLDRTNKLTQARRSAKEKELQQNRDERNKMKEEMLKWELEIAEIEEEISHIEEDRSHVHDEASNHISQVREDIQAQQNSIKALEEEIRLKGSQIKDLEEERKRLQENEDDEESRERERVEKEKDQQWELKLRSLQTQYASLSRTMQQLETNYKQAQERLSYARHAVAPAQFSPTPPVGFDGSDKRLKLPSNSTRRSRNGPGSSPVTSYPVPESRFSGSSAFQTVGGISAPFTSASPFFNMSNGMATIPNSSDHPGLTQGDIDALTGGAPMSPTADALLPSNLLGDEDPVGSSLSNSDGFPGLGPSESNTQAPGPQSPDSSQSRSPSLFSSPRESLNNVRVFNAATDGTFESDRNSVHSGTSFAPLGMPESSISSSSRLANLFGLNRQRGKTLPNDAPALGSLKNAQSQSFPRELDESAGLDPIGTRRRRGSHSGNWANMSNLLTRSSNAANNSDSGSSGKATSGLRRPFNMFSSKYDPLDPSKLLQSPSSPRPSSTHSFENVLPRPSSDSQPFGWPVTEGVGHRNSPLGADWSTPDPWSRTSSRRQSVSYGSTTNLPLGITNTDDDALQPQLTTSSSPSGPIGTRQRSLSRPLVPKLNPTAPTFKTFFSRSDAKKGEKALEKERLKDRDTESIQEEPSTPDTRASKDARSIHTDNSMADSRGSLDRSVSGTLSESLTSGTSYKDKESFIQKLTRKSSSSKFNMPWTKDKSGLFSKKPGDINTPEELDEDSFGESPPGKGAESSTSTPLSSSATNRSSNLWNSFKRRPRKTDAPTSEPTPSETAPSDAGISDAGFSEASELASETGEDDDGDD